MWAVSFSIAQTIFSNTHLLSIAWEQVLDFSSFQKQIFLITFTEPGTSAA